MATVRIPNNWAPRPYQRKAWAALEGGCRHAELIWHRRSGKDEVALHRAAVAAFERPANYWHMLPEYAQARKAIWDAVNPRTGIRRIDEAFPLALRQTTREQEMQIVFKNGASWQVVGSDSYNKLVGSTPAGVVFSEWALANPAARAYIRPILAENNGWQMYITTPRGRNHAAKSYEAARKDPHAFAQVLPATETGVFPPDALESERKAYIEEWGEDQGISLFEQEYLCSFDATILGAIYGVEMRKMDSLGRIKHVPYNPEFPVHTAWDLGRSDDTAIWFFQVQFNEVRVIDYHRSNGRDVDYYGELVKAKPYKFGTHWLPHDARAKTLASGGKSVIEQLARHFGIESLKIVPRLSVQDGIQAARQLFKRVWIDENCSQGIDALRNYQREWDEDKKCFKASPRHDWTSHAADAWRYMAIAWREKARPKAQKVVEIRGPQTIEEWINLSESSTSERVRI